MGIEKSRPVLITGCSTGIGRATAERLADDGWNVHATARRPESIEDLAKRGCKVHALDVTDEGSMRSAVKAVGQDGPIGALINNAGYSQSGAIEALPMESVRRQFETNVFGLMRMCQLVLPSMRESGSGRIVNLSSMGGKLTFPGGGVYHATKHAVEALSDALRFEVAAFGVDVVVLEPGLIVTEFGETASASMTDIEHGPYAKFNATVAKVTANAYTGPMARLGAGPEAVAGKIARALTVRRPATRYKVTPSAKMVMGMRRLMTDRMWDRFVRSQYPPPRPEGKSQV
jgi:NAD(P)-dependent dehydrogenase (short-subunit alcohol dehydrogenase family)